jgi:ABC-type iron transport system FetAB ATPase subunit
MSNEIQIGLLTGPSGIGKSHNIRPLALTSINVQYIDLLDNTIE